MHARDFAVTRVGHIGLSVADPEASARWYADVLGMALVARAGDGPYKRGIFMSFGSSDHDLGLFGQSPGASKGQEFEHIGLELECGGDLRKLQRFCGRLLRHQVRIHEILDHGVSKGIYFFDPDGHMLEVFCQQTLGRAAMEELARNEGMAEPFELAPVAQ